jgi:hypothetical protein
MADGDWVEYQLRWAIGAAYSASAVFRFKKERLLPALDALKVPYWLTLDEPDWLLVRIQVSSDERKLELQREIESSIQGSPLFSHVTVDAWSPTADAENRIKSTLGRLSQSASLPAGFKGPGWKIEGRVGGPRQAGGWLIGEQPMDEKVAEFAIFMTKVAGEFTAAFLRSMPNRVEDRWLKSVFVHLLLNSISTPMAKNGLGEEREVRDFPPI